MQHSRLLSKQRAVALWLVASFLLLGCGATEQAASPRTGNGGKLAVIHGQRLGRLNGTLVTEPSLQPPAGTFRDTQGRAYTFSRQPTANVTALYFGFTHCDDVCPTTMADLATARRTMPASMGKRVQVVFITVDPTRDTPAALRRWLNGYDSEIKGLRGSPGAVHAAERALYATASSIVRTKPPAPTPDSSSTMQHHVKGGYQVNHTGSVYVFGPDKQSVVYTGGTTPTEYAADFKRLLRPAQSD